MRKNIFFALLIIIILGGVASFFIFSQKEKIVDNEQKKSDLISIKNPKNNQTISSPLIIKGEARGFWFFEASFPVRLYDGDGVLIGKGIAQAESDWMTEDFIPFSAEILFELPTTKTGTLMLEKDNPSGLPEKDDYLRIPVRF